MGQVTVPDLPDLGLAEFEEAHHRLLADSSLQLELAPHVPPEAPAWLSQLIDLLVAIWPALKMLWWIGLFGMGLFLFYLIAARLLGIDLPWRARRSENGGDEQSWRPDENSARELLQEADLLAAKGRFSEAAHLLLFRSIEDIDYRRPNLVQPALTSREISSDPNIPPLPRSAFTTIVMLVETSLFGNRELDRSDWHSCRTAYEGFAFAEEWG